MFKKTEYALGLYATYAYTLKAEIASSLLPGNIVHKPWRRIQTHIKFGALFEKRNINALMHRPNSIFLYQVQP